MSKPKAPKVPSIPTSGETLESVINVLSERLPELQSLQVADALQSLFLQQTFDPAQAELGLAQEARFGAPIRAAQAEATRQTAAGQIFNVASISPSLRQAEAIASPETEAIRGELTSQIGSELAAGTQLDPQLRRELQQQVRAAQTARGISFGAAPVAEEALFVGSRALQLRQQRQAAASNLIRLNAATQVSPFSLLGGGGAAPGAPGALGAPQAPQAPGGGIAQQFLPQLFGAEQQSGLLQSQLSFNAAQLAPTGVLGFGGSPAGAVGGAAGGAFAGAQIGAAGGPIGALGGAGIGALLGFL